jgi:hypothetical protein
MNICDCTSVTVKANSLVATTVTTISKCLLCVCLAICGILFVDPDPFEFAHNFLLSMNLKTLELDSRVLIWVYDIEE